MNRNVLFSMFFTAGVMVAGCGGGEESCPVGSERCACTSASVCDPGLSCISGRCVNANPSLGGLGGAQGGQLMPISTGGSVATDAGPSPLGGSGGSVLDGGSPGTGGVGGSPLTGGAGGTSPGTGGAGGGGGSTVTTRPAFD